MLPDPVPPMLGAEPDPADPLGLDARHRRGVVPPGGRVSVPLLLADAATRAAFQSDPALSRAATTLAREVPTMTETTTLNDAFIADAAAQMADAVRGLPAEDAQQIVSDALRVAVLRAHDRRGRVSVPFGPHGGAAGQ